ncbi:ABC transporter permease [Micromonospora sp. NPDC005161]
MTWLLRRATSLAFIVGLPLVIFVALWFGTAGSTNFYLPSVQVIMDALASDWLGSRLGDDVLPSLERLAMGYLLAAVLGVGLGVLVGLSRPVRQALEPVLEFFRAIPPPVLVPVLILFAGIGTTMKVLVIASGALWPILLNSVEGVRAVDPVQLDTARCYRFSRRTLLRRVVLPAASPQIFAGLRQALSIAIILMVISEMFAATNGLGFAIVQLQRSFAIPEMWAGIVLLGLLGFALSILFRFVEDRVLAWHRGLRRAERS